jgi:hypothetical protein
MCVAHSLANAVSTLPSFDQDAICGERVKTLARTVLIVIDPEFADAMGDHPRRAGGPANEPTLALI